MSWNPTEWRLLPLPDGRFHSLIQGPGFSFTTLVVVDEERQILRVRRGSDEDDSETEIPIDLLKKLLEG